MKCQYCGKDHEKPFKLCPTCGGPAPERQEDKQGFYQFMNGYIVWCIQDYMRDVLEFYFYLGDRLVEHMVIPREFIRQHRGENPFATDDWLWNLFKVAQGEEEVLRIQEQNTRYPAMFEIRRIEHPDKQRWRDSVDMREMAEEFRR